MRGTFDQVPQKEQKKGRNHNSILPADPWCDSSYENQAYVGALRLYRQDKGCYESWEMLLGTEEKVSKHTQTYTQSSFLSVCGSPSTCLLNCVFACVGAGLPGDRGSVAMVTESASVQSEGQED